MKIHRVPRRTKSCDRSCSTFNGVMVVMLFFSTRHDIYNIFWVRYIIIWSNFLGTMTISADFMIKTMRINGFDKKRPWNPVKEFVKNDWQPMC